MLEWVDPKSTPKRVKPFSVYPKKFYINNNKQINENMEAEMKEMDEN